MHFDFMEMSFDEFMTKNEADYEIVKMVVTGEKDYKEIGNLLSCSSETIKRKIIVFSFRIVELYISFLKGNGIEVSKKNLYNFYQNSGMVAAYLEKMFTELNCYRRGKPELFLPFYPNLLPYRNLSRKDIFDIEMEVVFLKNKRKMSFEDIGDRLKLTKEKVRCIYNWYYHNKVYCAIEELPRENKTVIKEEVLHFSNSSKKQWEYLCKNYPD